MKEQGKRLMQMIGVAVKALDNLDVPVPAVYELGRCHVNYGVTAAHCDTVGEALLWTLDKAVGDKFTPAVKGARSETCVVLSIVMKDASYNGAADG